MKLTFAYLHAGLAGLVLTFLPQPSAAAVLRPKLQVINGSKQTVDVFWLKDNTERVSNGSIAPGKNNIISTTIGRRFVIVGRQDEAEVTVTSAVPVQAVRFDLPDKDGVPAFYTQRVNAHGYPIVASARVNPYALKEAAYLVDLMLARRPDVREAMIKSGSRLSILAWNEFTTDQPEWEWMAKERDDEAPEVPARDFWDARARGMGGSETNPFCSCGEENLLAYRGDPYSAENILIHEFAHNINLRGMVNVDPPFDPRLKETYDSAMKAGLWKGKYAAVNHHEYFAEGVQSWFDNNRFNDHDHNHVHLRSQLIEYDPGLAAMCREVFGDTELKYTKPTTRLAGHMEGYDPSKAPKFVWPERLTHAKKVIREKAVARDAAANVTAARPTGGTIIQYQARDISGWRVNIQSKLIESERADTEHALELLKKMLDEIVRALPAPAVAELRKVPLYFSPAYKAGRSGAEFHPDALWLRDNARDPVMARGVEFSGVADFEAEMKRMPNFALHELAHAYHFRVLKDGFDHAEIKAAFERVKASGKYERVERANGDNKPHTFERAYAMTNPMEYFAETSEAFFSRNDFFPFTRNELKAHDPEMFALLEKLWGVQSNADNPTK